MMADAKSYTILGVRIDALSMKAAAERIVERAADPTTAAVYVVKPYVEFLDQAGPNATIRAVLNGAWLSLPDGVSTQWAAAYLYGEREGGRKGGRTWWRAFGLLASILVRPAAIKRQLPERFGGTNFAWQLLEAAAPKQLRIYLVGTPNHSTIEAAATTIGQRLPQLKLVGTWPGQLGGKSGTALRQALQASAVEAELVADLKAKRPDIVLVGMGFPLQEKLIAKLAPQLSHGVLIGEGGTFDYDSFGGRRRKAPRTMQSLGLEWLWRLGQEPARWRRQLAIPRFVVKVCRSGR